MIRVVFLMALSTGFMMAACDSGSPSQPQVPSDKRVVRVVPGDSRCERTEFEIVDPDADISGIIPREHLLARTGRFPGTWQALGANPGQAAKFQLSPDSSNISGAIEIIPVGEAVEVHQTVIPSDIEDNPDCEDFIGLPVQVNVASADGALRESWRSELRVRLVDPHDSTTHRKTARLRAHVNPAQFHGSAQLHAIPVEPNPSSSVELRLRINAAIDAPGLSAFTIDVSVLDIRPDAVLGSLHPLYDFVPSNE